MMDGKKALAAAQEAIGKVSEAKVANDVIAPVEGDTASKAYDTGDYLMHDGKFCKAISAIAIGDPIILSGAGTNVTEKNVSSELGSGGGGGGTSDYDDLSNKPSINSTTLSGAMNAADLGLVRAESGKGLSSNDYTDTDKTKLAGLENYDDTALSGRVTTIEGMIPSGASSSNKLATASDIPSTSGFALKSEMSVVDGEGGNADKTTITLKTGTAATVLKSHQDISGKADKSEMSVTDGSGADADKTTIQLKSGTSATVLKSHQSITGKADKVQSATNGDFAGLDANGNLTDSGKKASDFTGKSFTGTSQEWAALSAVQKAEYTGMVNITDDTANAMLVDSTPTYNSNNLVKSGGVNAAIVNMLAPQFDPTETYDDTTGEEDLVVYEGVLYKCTSYHSEGAWNPAHFTAINDPKLFIISDGGKSVDGKVDFNDDIWAKNFLRFSKALVGYSTSGTLGSVHIGSNDYIKIDSGNYNYRADKYSMVEIDCTYGDSWYGNGGVLKIGAGNTSDGTQSTDIVKGITIDVFHNNDSVSLTGVLNINGSDYAEKFESVEDCPEGRFVTLDGEKIRLAQPDDDYILGVTSEKPAIIGDKDNPGTPVGLVGKLWVESDGTCKVNGFAVSGANGIATDGGSTGYRVMAVEGNRVKVLVK